MNFAVYLVLLQSLFKSFFFSLHIQHWPEKENDLSVFTYKRLTKDDIMKLKESHAVCTGDHLNSVFIQIWCTAAVTVDFAFDDNWSRDCKAFAQHVHLL